MNNITTKVCKTSDIGVNDNLFGGVMLSWLDESGAILACNTAQSRRMVTVMMDKVIFKEPVKVGDQIRIYGDILKIGNTSITISLEARRYEFNTNTETIVCSTEMVFVHIGEDGHSKELEING